MRFQPFRYDCNNTTINADSLSSSISKSRVAKQKFGYHKGNAAKQKFLLAVTTGIRCKFKPGHMEFSPPIPQVKRGNANKQVSQHISSETNKCKLKPDLNFRSKTRKYTQEIKSKIRNSKKSACIVVSIMTSYPPPMIIASSTIENREKNRQRKQNTERNLNTSFSKSRFHPHYASLPARSR